MISLVINAGLTNMMRIVHPAMNTSLALTPARTLVSTITRGFGKSSRVVEGAGLGPVLGEDG